MRKFPLKHSVISSISTSIILTIRAATLGEWLLHAPVRRTIAREFRTFLLEYTNEIGESVYGARINNLGERNLESLEVNYSHLRNTRATVAKFLAQCPVEVLKVFPTG
jgi:DNA replication licensing factor MCM2